MSVVGDRGAQCAALETEAAHEAEADPPRAEVTLDDRDLRQVARRVGDGLAVANCRRLDERLGDDLVGDEPDHARLGLVAPADPEALRGDGADPHRVLDPLGHLGARDLANGQAPFEHQLGPEALEVGQ